jgi:hypothetical protein
VIHGPHFQSYAPKTVLFWAASKHTNAVVISRIIVGDAIGRSPSTFCIGIACLSMARTPEAVNIDGTSASRQPQNVCAIAGLLLKGRRHRCIDFSYFRMNESRFNTRRIISSYFADHKHPWSSLTPIPVDSTPALACRRKCPDLANQIRILPSRSVFSLPTQPP